jgi:hypothetical protein
MNFKLNFSNEIEAREQLAKLLHIILDGLRIIVRSNDKLIKSIGQTYEIQLSKFLEYIPIKYMKRIFESANSIFTLLSCIDIDKLVTNKNNIHLPFNNQEITIKSKTGINKIKQIFILLIEDKFDEAREREFMKSLIGKLDPIFNCLVYICENTPSCIENCSYFKVINDIF